MEKTCRTCPRDAVTGLEFCQDCLNKRFFTEKPKHEPFVPEWRKRLTARDETGRLAA